MTVEELMFEHCEKTAEERIGSARKVNFYCCFVSEDVAVPVTLPIHTHLSVT